MQKQFTRGLLRPWAISLLVVAFGAITSGTADALTFDLNTEFDTGVTGPFSSVAIDEDGGDLNFVISLSLDRLGADSDLHVFYFNLDEAITGLTISDTDAPGSEYVLRPDRSVAGGAGSAFDWAVHFGNGAGAKGNGKLQSASFTLSADQDLSIADLLLSSFASGGTIEAQMAAHVQSTSALTGASSETIGGMISSGGPLPIPEPSTASLVVGAMALLGWRRGRCTGRFSDIV